MPSNLNDLKKLILELQNKIDKQEQVINAFNRQRITDSIEYSNLINEYNKILNSRTWKKTEPIRLLLNKIKGITVKDLRAEEVKHRDNIYNEWINIVENNADVYELECKPLISVIIPVYNVENSILKESIDSVINQLYSNWELVIVDDCSNNGCKNLLEVYKDNNKIKIIHRTTNGGISAATNDGLKAVSGDYICFLDCDDVLSLNALQEIVKSVNLNENIKLIYTDYDLMSEDGQFKSNPFFKPSYSPDTLYWNNYISHLVIYRKDLIDEVGLFDSSLDGSQDYDYVLRACELIGREEIYHIEKVLYHWRTRKESVSFSNASKPYAIDSATKARINALKRRNISGYIDVHNGINRVIFDNKNIGVSIIIPSKDNFESLKRCIDSIIGKTKYDNYEIIVVDNGSKEENRNNISKYLENNKVKYIYFNEQFNFSNMCNIGVQNSSKEVLCFINDDIEINDSNWISIMAGQAMQNYTGAVGCKLYYPNSKIIQHCGVGNYLGGPGHYLQGMVDDVDHYYCRNKANYNVIAVTAACLMVEKNKFIEVNGFNDELGLNYNDVDLCMKLYDKGYYNIVRNDITNIHCESLTRQPASVERIFKDRELLFELNNNYENYDPFYNKNLPQFSSNFDYERDLKLYSNEISEK